MLTSLIIAVPDEIDNSSLSALMSEFPMKLYSTVDELASPASTCMSQKALLDV